MNSILSKCRLSGHQTGSRVICGNTTSDYDFVMTLGTFNNFFTEEEKKIFTEGCKISSSGVRARLTKHPGFKAVFEGDVIDIIIVSNKYELEDWVKATEICSIIHRCAYSLENKVKRVNMFETILGFLRNNP